MRVPVPLARKLKWCQARLQAEISKRTTLFMVSMGAGTGCDAQYLFAEDVLGSNTGHYPRHAKRYRDFAAEYARLQKERVAAFTEFAERCEDWCLSRGKSRSGHFPGRLARVQKTAFIGRRMTFKI